MTNLIEGLSREEILGEIERAREANQIETVNQIKRELAARIPRGFYNLPLVECLRYAERALGLLIRKGQSGPDRYILGTWQGRTREPIVGMKTPMDFFDTNQERRATFYVTDDVSDEEFSRAVGMAKASGSMSRASVTSHLKKGRPSWAETTVPDRPAAQRKRRRLDVDRVIRTSLDQISAVFEGLRTALDDPEYYTEISPESAEDYLSEIEQAGKGLRYLRDNLKRGQGNG